MRRGAGAVALLVLLGGCRSTAEEDPSATSTPSPTSSEPADPAPDDPALDVALSMPREDSLYPDVGDPGVDALHYDLDLAWDPDEERLEAEERLVFRAARTADEVRLDLGEPLEVGDVLLDGQPVRAEHDGKDLVVAAPVVEDERHVLELAYAGTPEPVAAPTERGDFSTTGWTTTPDGESWTMQEPFGAYSWYAVNDQPSDKALYDISIDVPSPFVGVANGTLVSRTKDAGTTSTSWHLDDPAASYLVTVATGEYDVEQDESPSGVPISYWTPTTLPEPLGRGLREAPAAMAWLERRLGPFPFDSLGFLVVDSQSGMETQTMITLGATRYTTSPDTVVHEMVHQWYGDAVTPNDWRDMWMNEGMATYVQLMWASQHGGPPLSQTMRDVAQADQDLRDGAGPPAATDPGKFGDGNVYYPTALMWHELRRRIGDEAFWDVVRAWPEQRATTSTGRRDYWSWLEERTGEELTPFLRAWLLGATTPPVTGA